MAKRSLGRGTQDVDKPSGDEDNAGRVAEARAAWEDDGAGITGGVPDTVQDWNLYSVRSVGVGPRGPADTLEATYLIFDQT